MDMLSRSRIETTPPGQAPGVLLAERQRGEQGASLSIRLYRDDSQRYFLVYRGSKGRLPERVYEVSRGDAYKHFMDLDWIVQPADAFPGGIVVTR
jgi:hypothetical protein